MRRRAAALVDEATSGKQSKEATRGKRRANGRWLGHLTSHLTPSPAIRLPSMLTHACQPANPHAAYLHQRPVVMAGGWPGDAYCYQQPSLHSYRGAHQQQSQEPKLFYPTACCPTGAPWPGRRLCRCGCVTGAAASHVPSPVCRTPASAAAAAQAGPTRGLLLSQRTGRMPAICLLQPSQHSGGPASRPDPLPAAESATH